MANPLLRKMHRRDHDRVLLVTAPEELLGPLSQGAAGIWTAGPGEHAPAVAEGTRFGAIHLFVRSQAELAARLPQLRGVLANRGRLWVSWPKGRKDGTDLTLPALIRIAYDHNLVESTTIAVDDYWSAIKLTYPIPGKAYHNSYGTLPPPGPPREPQAHSGLRARWREPGQ